ncbi:MAG: phage tail sheath C-terminal domain-containing protein [Pseudomonadota bacterium]
MVEYLTPGVYVTEVEDPRLSIGSPAATAVPLFIGRTSNTVDRGVSLINTARRVDTQGEFESVFGIADNPRRLTPTRNLISRQGSRNSAKASLFSLSDCIRHFYANGGKTCFVLSVGSLRSSSTRLSHLLQVGISAAADAEGPTLVSAPELSLLSGTEYESTATAMLKMCARAGDRFAILDLPLSAKPTSSDWPEGLAQIDPTHRSYGAAYYPALKTTDSKATRQETRSAARRLGRRSKPDRLTRFLHSPERHLTARTKSKSPAGSAELILPPSAAVLGAYVRTDSQRGIWKAPANLELSDVTTLMAQVTDAELQLLSGTSHGEASINSIRSLSGTSVRIWGARTLAGPSHERLYVPVQRFIMMIETSIKKGVQRLLFEPNEPNTWSQLRDAVSLYLTTLWRAGALSGVKTEEAFYVRCGLGETMTQQDLQVGRLIIEIGIACLRPAEFIVTRLDLSLP